MSSTRRRNGLPISQLLDLAEALTRATGKSALMPPENDDELWAFVRDVFGVAIPRHVHPECVAHHTAPFEAFADSYFGRVPTALWIGSRGFAGKTLLLALLAATEAVTLGASVSLLAASEEQAQIAYHYLSEWWERPDTARQLPTASRTRRQLRLEGGGDVYVHTASTRSARGQHRPRLRVDEADEFRLAREGGDRIEVLDDALGQPMTAGGVGPQTVIASTRHHADGPVAVLERRIDAGELDARRYEWCYRESLRREVDGAAVGWLDPAEVDATRARMTRLQFRVEVELQQPRVEDRAIDSDAVDRLFDTRWAGAARGDLGQYLEMPCCQEYRPAMGPCASHRYATGVDWGRKRDLTAIVTYRTDTASGPWWLVAWEVQRDLPWPELAERLNVRLRRFPGPAAHDATGVGDAVAALIEEPATAVTLSGGARGTRAKLFTDYVIAIEQGQLRGPRIDRAWRDHRAVTRRDLYGAGHPPDAFVAGALAWSTRMETSYLDLDLGFGRLAGPGPLAGLE